MDPIQDGIQVRGAVFGHQGTGLGVAAGFAEQEHDVGAGAGWQLDGGLQRAARVEARADAIGQ